MNINEKLILNGILADFERDYNEEVFCDTEELIKAYKRLLKTLVSLDIINLQFSEVISFELNERLVYYEEWY